MQSDTVSEAIAAPESDRSAAVHSTPVARGGLLYQWGPQAWIDMVMSYLMLVRKGTTTLTYTFVPLLRITADAERIDREWKDIKLLREKTRLLDSPRERWRKNYGNFVREIEWALLELRKHYTQEQYEEIVVGTSVALAYENSAGFLDMMNSMSDTPAPKKAAAATDGPKEPSRLQKLMFDMFNPAGFLTGPAEITEFDPGRGSATMEIPECAWHICAAQETLPNPEALPQEGCLLICKGAFERLFDGKGGGLRMEFDPHLPETSCTVYMTWKTD